MATLTLDQENPAHGDTIHLTADYDPDELQNKKPYASISLNVYQDGAHVYSAFTGLGWGVYPTDGNDFLLEADSWPGGAGDAVAEFFSVDVQGAHRSKPLATLEFTVAA